MNNIVEVKTTLSIIDYVTIVDAIVTEFFNEDGEYTPHIGKLNAMRLFYNECITDNRFELPHDITDALQMEVLVENDEFITAFDKAIKFEQNSVFSFANAYKDALSIVEVKKTSINQVASTVKSIFVKIVDSIVPMFTEENIQRLEQISNEIASGKISNQSIIDALGNSDIFKKIVENN